MIGELESVLLEKDIKLECDKKALDFIAEKSYSSKFGARNMRRFIQTEIEDNLAELIISDYNRRFSAFIISAENGELKISSK